MICLSLHSPATVLPQAHLTTPLQCSRPSPQRQPPTTPASDGPEADPNRMKPRFSLNAILTHSTDGDIISRICRGVWMSRRCKTESLNRAPTAYAAAPQAALGTARPSMPKLPDRVRRARRSGHYSRRTEQTCRHWVKRLIYGRLIKELRRLLSGFPGCLIRTPQTALEVLGGSA